MKEKLAGFPPVAGDDAKVLILGTMPGVKSLQDFQYYAHPQNAFWFIMSSLFLINPDFNYQQKLTVLTENRIALWDVLQSCHRQGSLDSNIRNASANNLSEFINLHQSLVKICFNGQKAQQLFDRHISQSSLPPLAFETLPSTSPAMARLTRQQKFEVWKKALAEVLF